MKKIKLFLFAAMLLGGVGLHASNTITYTATEQQSGYSGSLAVGRTTFGSAITSHTFSNGTGTITCSGEITTIEEYAFWSCTDLTSITIPNSVTTIGNSAFVGCTGLTSITIPNSVTTVGDGAFYDCSGLTSVTIGNSVTTIENYAFYGCSGLTSITIPNSVTTIGHSAFIYCRGLTSVTVSWTDEKSIPSIDSNVFEKIAHNAGPSGATLHVLNGTAALYQQANEWKYFGNIVEYITTITYTASAQLPGYNGSLQVGATTFGSAITSHTFSNGTGTITCNGMITTIGNSAFNSCTGLISIEIPNTITEIGEAAFYGCTGLTSIEIPSSVTKIGNSAFNSCTGLISIEIPNTVTEIGEAAFFNCTGLTSIEIPNSVDSIRRYAFQGCTGLTSIEIPSSVTKIRDNAFWACSGLTSVTVFWTDSESIAPIESTSFGKIANGAGRSGATLHVPNGTAALYQQAKEWNKFGRIECDLIKVNNLWYRPLNVRTVNLIVNQDTTATGERIPYSGDVVIPNTIIYNGNNSISAIEDSVFYNAKLTSLTVLTDIPLPCEQYTFLGQDKSIPVYVLDVDAFKRAQYWNKFTNIQFYAPYRDEAKQKLIGAANSVPNEHSAEAQAIAEAYGKKMDGLNTAAAIDKLYAQALEEIQAFMDETLWTLDETGCMTLPKP